MRHTMTITALTAALLISTAAHAETSASASVESLPDKGMVSLSGTVDRVVDGDTFVLRDAAGDTIDVHSNAQLTLKKGDSVSVKGEKTAEIAGMGAEIEKANVTIGGNRSASASNRAGGTAAPTAARDNTDRMGARETADAATATGATTAMNDTIEALPKEGAVELNGVVDRVSSDNKFILRDADGETIDIHTAANVDVKPGDSVSVNGNVKSELLGFGRQIEGAQVLVVSSSTAAD